MNATYYLPVITVNASAVGVFTYCAFYSFTELDESVKGHEGSFNDMAVH